MSFVPYEALADESWGRLEAAGNDPGHPMRLLVLANVCDAGSPEARMMTLRGASRRLGRLWFYADRRSEKVEHLRRHPEIATVAFDPRVGVQLRVRGTAVIDDSDQAERHWSQASMGLRALFASPDAPGLPLRLPDPRLMDIKRSLEAGEEAAARGNFSVIEITVDSIDWLQVLNMEQRRAVMFAATDWAVQPLAP